MKRDDSDKGESLIDFFLNSFGWRRPCKVQFSKCRYCGAVFSLTEENMDPEEKNNFRCPNCKRGLNHRDLIILDSVKKKPAKKKPAKKSTVKKSPVEEPPLKKPPVEAPPCLFVFAVFLPDVELINLYSKQGKTFSFTEEVKDVLLGNNVCIGTAKVELFDDLKKYFSVNSKENGDIYMFIVEGRFDEYKSKIENSDFYLSDLKELYDVFIQKNSCVQELTAVDSTIDILSDDSPFDIPFIKP